MGRAVFANSILFISVDWAQLLALTVEVVLVQTGRVTFDALGLAETGSAVGSTRITLEILSKVSGRACLNTQSVVIEFGAIETSGLVETCLAVLLTRIASISFAAEIES